MTMLLYVNEVKSGDFSITAKAVGSRLVVNLAGTADSTVIEPLRDYLGHTAKELSTGQFTSVEFDIHSLYLLNSSCLKVFATFVHELSNTGSVTCVCFGVSSTLAWQQRAIIPLERLAPRFVVVEQR
jgi:hypothetical protein